MRSQPLGRPSRLRARLAPLLIGFFSAALVLALFDFFALRVFALATTHFDFAARTEVHSVATPLLSASARFLTWLGSTAVLPGIAFALWLGLRERVPRYEALVPLIAIGCAELLDAIVKFAVKRPRPPAWLGLHNPKSWSFPSGHALDSSACYLVFAALLLPLAHSRASRAAILALAIALPVAIGLTRIYLGVHWPTDVLAGWIAGTCLAIGLIRSLDRRTAAANERRSAA